MFDIDADVADVVAYEHVWIDREVEGFCTSGSYSHFAQKSITMALVLSKDTAGTLEAEVEILGEMYHAKRITNPYP